MRDKTSVAFHLIVDIFRWKLNNNADLLFMYVNFFVHTV